MAATKQASKGIHPDFEIQGRRHQKSKTAVSVAPQSFKKKNKNKQNLPFPSVEEAKKLTTKSIGIKLILRLLLFNLHQYDAIDQHTALL